MADRSTNTGVVAGAVVAGAAVVVVLAGALVFGVRGGGGHDAPATAARSTSTASTPTPVASATALDPGEVLHLRATGDGTPVAVPVIDELRGGDVLRIRADGLVPAARGTVEQCRRAATHFTRCTNAFPVQADAEGVALFQYELVAPRGCDASGSCAVVVRDGNARASAHVVFGEAAAPPARLSLDPAGPYRAGQRVTVTAAGLVPGTEAAVAFCTPRCVTVVEVRADDAGRAVGTVTLGTRCGDRGCTVSLVGSGARDAAVAVAFVPPPRPDLDARRVVASLLGACALLLLAWFVARRTDWRPPSEASTPTLDAARL